MQFKLAVKVGMVFAGLKGERRHVDGDVKHSEKGECQHGRYALYDRLPADQTKLCLSVSSAFGVDEQSL